MEVPDRRPFIRTMVKNERNDWRQRFFDALLYHLIPDLHHVA